MKKNRFLRLGAALLVLTLITCCALSGTLARYIATDDGGKATARAAKFDPKIDDFATVSLVAEGVLDTKATAGDYTETHVATMTGETEEPIAPGTFGWFEIIVDNTGSEVAIDATISPDADDMAALPAGIKFCTYTGETAVTSANAGSLMSGLTFGALGDSEAVVDALQSETVTVFWKWEFGESVDDTAYQGEDFEFGLTATFEQID